MSGTTPPHGAARGGRLRALAVALLALPALGGCAGLSSDVHLSPLVSHLSTAGGGRELEALAGAVRVRRPHPAEPLDGWALRPLVSEEIEPSGDRLAHFLVPLGWRRVKGPERINQLLPLWRNHVFLDEHGHPEWRFLLFPILLFSHDVHGRALWAVFPLAGVTERFLSFDRLTFFLFPLFTKTERGTVTGWHLLWPFFCVATDVDGIRSWRVWPLYGKVRTGDDVRRFFLWPIFQWQHNDQRKDAYHQERKWLVFPLIGHARAGGFSAWTWLWPFFGYSHNPENGFWSWDGPWPLVRIQRPGESDRARRTRLWPFWSHYLDPFLEATSVLWPIFTTRHERFRDGERRAQYVVPLWQNWRRTDREGAVTETWTKLWPLYQRHGDEREPDRHSRTALPALNPLWHTPVIDDHYAWIYELYTRETEGSDRVRERSWGGLWRRDRDPAEERSYIAFLWSKRKYGVPAGTVRETSLLLGLLRWRRLPDGSRELLRPAFPGPGWPAERLPEP